MQVTLHGQPLKLKPLTDPEYSTAERLARNSSTPLYQCPTCGTKETVIPDSGGVREFINGSYQYKGQTFPCECQAQIALRARYLVANIGYQYMTLDWDEYDGDQAALDAVALYMRRWEGFKRLGMGLEFSGKKLGIGKTFAATHIGKELIKLGQRVYFTSFMEMVDAFSHDEGRRMSERLKETTYLILDEIVPPMSAAQGELYAVQFEALIRHRTNHNLPTIITTNLSEEEISDWYPRIYSLLSAKQIRVWMEGNDARQGKVQMENIELAANGEVRPIT